MPPPRSISATTLAARCLLRPVTSTRAPRAASARAEALPIPLVEPVTRAVLSFRRLVPGEPAQRHIAVRGWHRPRTAEIPQASVVQRRDWILRPWMFPVTFEELAKRGLRFRSIPPSAQGPGAHGRPPIAGPAAGRAPGGRTATGTAGARRAARPAPRPSGQTPPASPGSRARSAGARQSPPRR